MDGLDAARLERACDTILTMIECHEVNLDFSRLEWEDVPDRLPYIVTHLLNEKPGVAFDFTQSKHLFVALIDILQLSEHQP